MPILDFTGGDGGIRSLQLQYTFRILRHSQAHDSEYAQGLRIPHASRAGDSLVSRKINSSSLRSESLFCGDGGIRTLEGF